MPYEHLHQFFDGLLGPSTSAELAVKARLHERWVREWLHGQASAGLVRYAGDGRFELTAEQAAVLADEENPAFVGGGLESIPLLQRWERSSSPSEPAVAFPTTTSARTMPWERADSAARGCERTSSPSSFQAWTASLPKLTAGATVADIGCGSGKALLEMAKAHTRARSFTATTTPTGHPASLKRTLPDQASAMSPSIVPPQARSLATRRSNSSSRGIASTIWTRSGWGDALRSGQRSGWMAPG